MDTASVIANSRNKRPTTSVMNSSGISTAISEKVSEISVKPICEAPFNAACMGVSPSSRWRAMFSIMTMASSTTKPVAIVSAIKVRLLMEKPARYMTPNVPTSDSGTTTLGISVAVRLRRNTKVTMTTSATASSISNFTSSTESRMVCVRSDTTVTSSVAGKAARNCGNSVWMRLTTSITLAPGWRWMFKRMAGLSPTHAAWRVSSAPSTARATSDRRSGALFL
ncbi:hypothetical protein D3C85_837240 [compost metagenome]